MLSLLLITTLLFGTVVQNIHSWGLIGHSIVAQLAQNQLNEQASNWVKALVPWYFEGNLTAIAVWADDILYPDTNFIGHLNWPWSRPLHYINTPDWACNYVTSRDCINDFCVEGALRNYSKRIIDISLSDIQHQEALMFLVHYVGDIHQPLHVGFLSDRGGNSIRGYFMNKTSFLTNLHSLWDSGLINFRFSSDFQSNFTRYYTHIYDLMLNQTPTDDDNNFHKWGQESSQIVCEHVYFDDTNMTMNASINFTLGFSYYEKNIRLIEARLAQGGRRLAALLNQLAANRLSVTSGSRCLFPITHNFILLILIICSLLIF